MHVYVRVKTLGKRKDVMPPKPYELPEGIGSLRELLTAFVEAEVERYGTLWDRGRFLVPADPAQLNP